MDIFRLLASVILSNRRKHQLEQLNIQNSKDRMLWWYDNTVGKRIKGSSRCSEL